MPGNIRVSVLEAVDLPQAFADGAVKDLIVKVRLGRRQFETESRAAVEGRVESWNSAFVFLITNLRDKLVVTMCDNADQCLTQTSIEVSSIIEKGCRDEFVELKGGGRIHLIMSFVLTDQERRKIETMRLRVLKRREQERAKRTIVFQNVLPSSKELKAATVPAVIITDVDSDSALANKELQEFGRGPVGFGSTSRPLKPILMFDYARAVGLQLRQASPSAVKRSNVRAAGIVSEKIEASINGFKSDTQEFSNNESGLGSPVNAMINSSVISPKSLRRAASSLTSSMDIASTRTVIPCGQDPSSGKVILGDSKIQSEVLCTTLSKGQDNAGVPASNIGEDKWGIEGKSACVLNSESPIIANSPSDRSILVGEHMSISGFLRDDTHLPPKDQTRIWNKQRAVLKFSQNDIPNFEGLTGHGQRLEVRPGPGARWAQKTDLESRWTSPEKAGQIVRCTWNGPVSDPFKARAKILKLIRAASAAHDVCGDDQRLEERHGLSDSIGVVLNKVVGGAAIFLVALFMMCPISEGPSHGINDSNDKYS